MPLMPRRDSEERFSGVPPELRRGPGRRRKEGLRLTQIRVLLELAKLPPNGSLSRNKLSERTGLKVPPIIRSVGPSDPVQRAYQESEKCSYGGYPTLITLCMVVEECIDVDGLEEWCYSITELGRQEASKYDENELPAQRDSYRDKRESPEE